MLHYHANAAQVGKQLECRCGHVPPCQFWQKAWGPIPEEILVVREPQTKQAAEPRPRPPKPSECMDAWGWLDSSADKYLPACLPA